MQTRSEASTAGCPSTLSQSSSFAERRERPNVRDLVSIDFFTVPTAGLRVLFVLVVLAHDRRRVLHFNVTEHPTAAWTAQQIVDAFPDAAAPSSLLRDRDKISGHSFRQRVKGMGIDEILTAPYSPWQNPFAERLIGSVRRECLDHVLVLSERHLRRILTRYFVYYHRARTHLSLEKDAPDMRPIQRPEVGVSLSGAVGTARVTHSERRNGLLARHVLRSETRGNENLGPSRKSRLTPKAARPIVGAHSPTQRRSAIIDQTT